MAEGRPSIGRLAEPDPRDPREAPFQPARDLERHAGLPGATETGQRDEPGRGVGEERLQLGQRPAPADEGGQDSRIPGSGEKAISADSPRALTASIRAWVSSDGAMSYSARVRSANAWKARSAPARSPARSRRSIRPPRMPSLSGSSRHAAARPVDRGRQVPGFLLPVPQLERRPDGLVPQPVALVVQPVLELRGDVLDVEPLEEVPAVELERALGMGGRKGGLEPDHVRPHPLGDRDLLVPRVIRAPLPRHWRSAYEGLAERVPAARGVELGPESARREFPAVETARGLRKVDQERQALGLKLPAEIVAAAVLELQPAEGPELDHGGTRGG